MQGLMHARPRTAFAPKWVPPSVSPLFPTAHALRQSSRLFIYNLYSACFQEHSELKSGFLELSSAPISLGLKAHHPPPALLVQTTQPGFQSSWSGPLIQSSLPPMDLALWTSLLRRPPKRRMHLFSWDGPFLDPSVAPG